MTCPHCDSCRTDRYDMEYHGDYVEFYHDCNHCGTEWTVSYGLCDPNVDITARGCDCKGNGCIECAPERDPDEKFEQKNNK